MYHVYILTNDRRTVLYTGVTNNLARRVWEHRHGEGGRFTSRYRCRRLVYAQETKYVHDAVRWERTIKGWTRAKKIALINQVNPEWADLMPE
ncbi:MAG: GIY-YIG nuclease family protein [Propionibacteriaceae bacterium]|jgi:putative endonuclease|nr:GIY-YIG nuclease family protein [Propionibacteriaceae bacterium]